MKGPHTQNTLPPQKKTKVILEQSPSIFDSEAYGKALKAKVKESGGMKEFLKGGDFVNDLMRTVFQNLLDLEMEEHLGHDRYERTASKNNFRNGKLKKKVRGDFGEIEISTPRDRACTFEPQLIKKHEKTVSNFSDKIISLYTRGMTTRDIGDHLREMYGVEVSPEFISRATGQIMNDAIEWQNRALDSNYPILYVDGLRVSVKEGNNIGSIINKCVYVVLGVSSSGQQEVLGLWINETEGAKFWLSVFNDLKARGVQDVLLLCADGLKGLPDAAVSVFPDVDVQLCVVHQIRNSTKFVSYKDRKELCADMKPIYSSPTIEAAEHALSHFKEKWEKRYPYAVKSWEENWLRLTTFYKYPVELRKIIYTTNKIESLNSQLRKNIASRKIFPNNDAVTKLLYLNIKNFTKKWGIKQDWGMMMNQLAILCPKRMGSMLNL